MILIKKRSEFDQEKGVISIISMFVRLFVGFFVGFFVDVTRFPRIFMSVTLFLDFCVRYTFPGFCGRYTFGRVSFARAVRA